MKQVNTKHHCLEILFYSLRINCCFKALEVFCILCTALLVVFDFFGTLKPSPTSLIIAEYHEAAKM